MNCSKGDSILPSSARRGMPRLLEVLDVFLVFGAEVFVQVLVRNQSLPQRVRESLAVGLGIVDRHVDLEVANIEAPKTLDQVQIGAVRMAHTIEPTAFPESAAVDNERIAFPPSGRITH